VRDPFATQRLDGKVLSLFVNAGAHVPPTTAAVGA
jgi:hypothetical protein